MSPEGKYEKLSQEWDDIAEERFRDLVQGNDKSYNNILKPNMISALEQADLSDLLDIGCGVGVFTEEVSKLARNVIAIDVSCKSIEIAKANTTNANISYICINFDNFQSNHKFSTIMSSMTLMTMPNIENVFDKINNLLTPTGKFIFTITHPSFWPIYWNYYKDNFEYCNEKEIITDFKTRFKTYKNHKTRHYHRSLSYYINELVKNGLTIKQLHELKGEEEANWYPRFLLIVCSKE